MKRRGFTLIELLAVIVVLALIAVIASPMIINVIENSKEKGNLQSINGILESTNLYISEAILYNDRTLDGNIYEEIKKSTGGKLPQTGQIYVNNDKEIALAIKYDNYCYLKSYQGTVNKYELENCTLNFHKLIIQLDGGIYDGNSNDVIVNLVEGEKYILKVPTKDKYTFSNWSVIETDEPLEDNKFIMGNNDTTIVANWQLNSLANYNFDDYYIVDQSLIKNERTPLIVLGTSANSPISKAIPDDVDFINVIDVYALHNAGFINGGTLNIETGAIRSNYPQHIDINFCENNTTYCKKYSKEEFLYTDSIHISGNDNNTVFSYNSSDKKIYVQNGNESLAYYLAFQFVVNDYLPSNWEYCTGFNNNPCLHANTIVYVYDRKKKKFKKKKIKDVTYDDELLVWDFDRGIFSVAKPLWIKKKQTTDSYNLLTFSDGSKLRTINQHRIFNKEKGMFTLAMTDDTPIGTTTYTSNGNYVTLLDKKIIKKRVDYYNIITDYHINLFTDNILTSCRLSNIYPIKDMKYIKEKRNTLVEGIKEKWIKGLRLNEQPSDINENSEIKYNSIKDYIENLEKLDIY